MKKLFAILCIIVSFPLASYKSGNNNPSIDLVFCIDLSSSTNGILDIFRENFWKVINDFTYYQPMPKVRVGFVAFGRPNYGKDTNFIHIVSDLTYDYDELAKKLFDIKPPTVKGDCFVMDVMNTAMRSLSWDKEESTLKLMYVVGNGSPYNSSGTVDIETIKDLSRKKGIIITPIYYKSYNSASEENAWIDFAESCGHDLSVASLLQPYVILKKEYDNEVLFSANNVLNDTYIYYGKDGSSHKQNQVILDQMAAKGGENEMESRVIIKTSDLYQGTNASWDLIDLLNTGNVNYDNIDKKFLPEKIKNLETDKLKAYITGKRKEREDIVALIAVLNKKRAEYLKEAKKIMDERGRVDNSLPTLLIKNTHKLSKEWEYSRLY